MKIGKIIKTTLLTILVLFALIIVIGIVSGNNDKKPQETKTETVSENTTTQEKIEFYAKHSQTHDELQSVKITGLNNEIVHIKYNQQIIFSEDSYLQTICYVYPTVADDIFKSCPEIQTITFWFMIEEKTAVRFDLNRSTLEKITDLQTYKAECTLDYNKFIDSVDSIYILPEIKAKLTTLKTTRKTI